MLNIMVVSENRILLKDIYSYLYEEEKYIISIINYSANSLEEFIKLKPDIVILDANTITPYNTIIKQLKSCNWQYDMIIIHNNDYIDVTIEENKKWLNKRYLSKEKLINTLENLYENINNRNERGDNYIFISEEKIYLKSNLNFYTLLFAKYTGKKNVIFTQEQFEKFKLEISAYGNIDIICKENKDILLSISKQVNTKLELKRIIKIVQKFCFEDYSILLSEKVNWKDLQYKSSEIVELSEYAYFYHEQIIYVEELYKQIDNIYIKDLNNEYIKVINAIFLNNEKDIIYKLKNIYIRTIKEKLDFNAIYYIRGIINILDILIKCITNKDLEGLNFKHTNIEDEFEYSKNKFLQYTKLINERKIPQIVKKAVLYIFENATKDISLQTTSQDMDVSKVYLSRVFKKEIGITFMDFLKIVKMYNAKHLLTYTDLKIYEISDQVGYFDSHYFCRQFKKRTSFTPEEYRRFSRKEQYFESSM